MVLDLPGQCSTLSAVQCQSLAARAPNYFITLYNGCQDSDQRSISGKRQKELYSPYTCDSGHVHLSSKIASYSMLPLELRSILYTCGMDNRAFALVIFRDRNSSGSDESGCYSGQSCPHRKDAVTS